MRNHRFVKLVVAAAAVTAVAGMAVAAPSQATSDQIVKLVSNSSGKCLQPINGSLVQGDAVVQQTCNGSLAQQWQIHGVSSTAVHLINRQSQLCMDARGGATNGTPIQQWTCNTISNEKWGFGITNNLLGSQVGGTASHCIASPGSQDGLPMELRFCDGNITQLWSRPAG
jgi:hypothetical protein